MPGADTTFTERAKSLARHPKTKIAGLGGGATGGVLVLVYQLFVTHAEFADYKQEATRKASVLWQELKTLENDLDSARMEIVRLQTLRQRTNTP